MLPAPNFEREPPSFIVNVFFFFACVYPWVQARGLSPEYFFMALLT